MGKNNEVAEMAKKAMKKLKKEVAEKGLEGKSKMIALCGFLEDKLH